ncbi:U11/U12 small nuclear ribonucleoprotein 31 kDa protein, partial [Mucuna pruriens]
MASKNKARKKRSDSEEDDDVFYYRYSSGNPIETEANPKNSNKGSSSLAPSKSTLYVSNIDYSLTNSDLHTLFSTFGRIARVTVLKDRHTRLSRGVAFIQFVSRHDARAAAAQMHRKVLNGRTLTASIAADNGRAPEFIRKRVYRDTARCFECGADGHLSYDCPRNQLGPRPRPEPKRPRHGPHRRDDGDESDGPGPAADRFEDDNWASVVDDGADERLLAGNVDDAVAVKKKKKKAGYFSDESDEDDYDATMTKEIGDGFLAAVSKINLGLRAEWINYPSSHFMGLAKILHANSGHLEGIIPLPWRSWPYPLLQNRKLTSNSEKRAKCQSSNSLFKASIHTSVSCSQKLKHNVMDQRTEESNDRGGLSSKLKGEWQRIECVLSPWFEPLRRIQEEKL